MKTKVASVAGILAIIFFLSTATAQERAGRSGSGRRVTVPASEVVNGDYFAFGRTVEISGTINGDLYASGGQIVIDGTVNGDLLVAGGRVSLSGTVSQDVRAAGGQVTISGTIGRNLTVAGGQVELAPSTVLRGGLVAAGGNIDLSAPVTGSVKAAAGTLTVANRVGGNVDAAVGTLRIASKADIQGDVNYWSRREVVVSEGARIRGKIVRNVPPKRPRIFPAAFFAWLGFVSINFISTLILGLLSVRFLPRFHQSVVTTLSERPWLSLGIGFVAAVVAAGCVQPFVCDRRRHSPRTHSFDRVFHHALLGTNLRDRPNRRIHSRSFAAGFRPRLCFCFGTVCLLPSRHHSFHRMARGPSGDALRFRG